MKRLIASALMLLLSLSSQAQMRLVSIDGSITEIIYAPGIDYHRCATWCAVGEIPFLIAANDGNT